MTTNLGPCTERVYSGRGYSTHRCGNWAVALEDGKGKCRVHSAAGQAAIRERTERAYRERTASLAADSERKATQGRVRAQMLALVVRLAGLDPDDSARLQATLHAARGLCEQAEAAGLAYELGIKKVSAA